MVHGIAGQQQAAHAAACSGMRAWQLCWRRPTPHTFRRTPCNTISLRGSPPCAPLLRPMQVVAHECGHQAFSKWQAVNDGVGLVFHSLLLVPYYSW